MPTKQKNIPLHQEAEREDQAQLTQQERWILRWLMRYPFLRVADLMAFTDMSRASLYRSLGYLEQKGLAETVIPVALGKRSCACFYVSNQGLHLVAEDLGCKPASLARNFGTDERGLLRLLPRLAPLVLVQEFLLDLCRSAQSILTYQGQRSNVAWHWLRDYIYPLKNQSKFAACTVSALLVMRVRPSVPVYPDALRQEQAQQYARQQERWYGLNIVLDSPIAGAPQVRSWLKQLCLARDQRGETSFPATAILVAAPERLSLWQSCMRRLMEIDQLSPLQAALTVSPSRAPTPRKYEAPWHLPWLHLGTQVPCHLQDLLVPLPVEALPADVLASLKTQDHEEGQFAMATASSPATTEREGDTHASVPATAQRKRTDGKQARLIQGHFAERLWKYLREEELVPFPLACLALSEREIKLLVRIELFPFASTEEVAIWEDLQFRSAERYLGLLRREGWIYSTHDFDALKKSVDRQRWLLSERGIRALASIYGLSWKHLAILLRLPEEGATEFWLPRRAAFILQCRCIPQVISLYTFFARLAQAAREQSGHQLHWWSRELGQHTYKWNGATYQLQPEALAEYSSQERTIRFWLEYEHGDPSVRDLAKKLSTYAAYLRSRDWMRERLPLPVLCYLVRGPAQEQRLARVAYKLLSNLSGFRLVVTTEGRLQHAGVLGAIWWQVVSEPSDGGKPARRLTLLEL